MAAPAGGARKKAAKTAQKRAAMAINTPACPKCGKNMVATLFVSERRQMRWKCTCGTNVPVRH
ncbi:MAG: hypothetical protein HYV63_23255 [Candidatus Schekmanbacteria bacterium]|nr:hypothetical protein [Candidatus Schekmanbacteria bacterium]